MNNTKLLIYPETTVDVPNLDFSNGLTNWTSFPYTPFILYNNSLKLNAAVSTCSATLVTTAFTGNKTYTVSYTVSNANSDTEHFVVLMTGASKRNKGNGTFIVNVKALESGTPSWDNRFFITVTANAKQGMIFSNFSVNEYEEIELETYENAEIPLTYQIADIKDFTKRNTSFSKTIILPGTQENNINLKHAYRVASIDSTVFEKPIRCSLFNNSINIFNGSLYLQNVTLNNEDNTIEYECQLRNSINTLYSLTSQKYLRGNTNAVDDLDFSEWDHTLNIQNIEQSWYKGSEIRSGYRFLPSPSGWNDTLGQGFVYPLVDYGFNDNILDISDMRGSLFIKEILIKILNKAGFTYTSNFIDSEFFSRLIYLKSNEYNVEEEDITDRGVELTQSSVMNNFATQTVTHNKNSYTLPYTADLSISGTPVPQMQYNVPVDGTYDFFIEIKEGGVNFQLSIPSNEKGAGPNDNKVDVYDVSVLDTEQPISNVAYIKFALLRLPRAGETKNFLLETQVINIRQDMVDNKMTISKYPQRSNFYAESGENGIYAINHFDAELLQGDTVMLYVSLFSEHTVNKKWQYRRDNPLKTRMSMLTSFTLSPNTITMRVVPTNEAQPFEGDTVRMTNCLHKDVTQSNFILSLVKMFNLYIDEDRTNPNNLIIEPYTNFISGGITRDWKRDMDLDFVIEAASDIANKNIYFSYAPDTDDLNVYYTGNGVNIYGENRILADIKTTEEYDVTKGIIFSPLCMDDFVNLDTSYDKIITPILKKTGSKPHTANHKPRIAYWNGLTYWKLSSGKAASWSLISKTPADERYYGEKKPNGLSSAFYPYAGHVDNPLDGQDTLDLNFGSNYWYYWNIYGSGGVSPTNNITYNNLVHAYYSEFLSEMANPNSKKVTGYFWLTDEDIHNFSFRDVIIIDNVHYRVNKIFDYTGPEVITKVELLKIEKVGIPVTPDKKYNKVAYDKYAEAIGSFTPQPFNRLVYDRPYHPEYHNTLMSGSEQRTLQGGKRNIIGSGVKNSKVIGDYNRIGIRSEFINIINSDYIDVAPDLRNVTVINSSNLSITESDVTYIDGKKYKDNVEIEKIDIIRGGVDTLQYKFSPVIINRVDGGRDDIRNFGSFSNKNLISNN